MPSLDLILGPAGVLLQVHLGVSRPYRDVLRKHGRTVPALVQGTFLIDTGASHTVVDPGLVAPLGLRPAGSVPINTPSTGASGHICDEYDVSLSIPAIGGRMSGHRVDAMPVIIADLRPQGLDGLIGRDVPAACILIVNGPGSSATLAF